MPDNFSSDQSTSPLTVGNVVSASLQIYRDHFNVYYTLAFQGYLWILVPIYGWAKFSAILALISRLAYGEVTERPETVDQARRYTNTKMWSFFGAGILVGLIFFAVMLGVGVVLAIVSATLITTLQQTMTGIVVLILLGFLVTIALMIGYIRLLCRFWIVEVPLAIEENLTATSAISRSWDLTKGFVGRIQWIIVVAFLLTIPLSIAIQIIQTIAQIVLAALFSANSPTFNFLNLLLSIGLAFASGSLLIPFWQAIKAIIYYDLRSRREGLGLGIRDSR